ncbi:MAG TPA: VWA domain-containing protein [Planctomycetota bacterium]
MSTLRKILGMSVLAGVCATLGALGGELMFVGAAPAVPERSICLLFDVSGSMAQRIRTRDDPAGRTQLQALQEAAVAFVQRQDLRSDALGLAVFSTGARVLVPIGHDTGQLVDAIGRLQAQGATDLAGGLDTARSLLGGINGERWVLLFSDGKPESVVMRTDPVHGALAAAAKARDAGLQIVAIGTGLADEELLAQVTGSAQNVFVSAPERLAEAFERSEQYIDSRQLLASRAGAADFQQGLERAAIWASLIAIGAGLGMVSWQNRHLRRRAFSLLDLLCILFGGALTGSLAGAAGQSLFWALAEYEQFGAAARTVAWIVLGLGCGLGMSLFVPNLNRGRAIAGGMTGGIVAAGLFLGVVPVHGDTAGRLASAAALGAFTAIALVLLEATSKGAWLVVHWSPREHSKLLLGSTPIVVGRAAGAHIRMPNDPHAPPVLARIQCEGAQVMVEDPGSERRRAVADGTKLEFGRVTVEVRIGEPAADARPPRQTMAPPPAAQRPPAVPAPPPRARQPAGSGRSADR